MIDDHLATLDSFYGLWIGRSLRRRRRRDSKRTMDARGIWSGYGPDM